MQQVSFEFSFSVGKLQTSLFKSASPTEERHFADAVLEGFGLTFDLRKYDMSVDIFLRSVTLAMVEKGEVRRPLLSSANEDKEASDLKLLQVRYMRVQKDSPEFMSVHDGVDQSVEVQLSTINVTVAPEPILALYDFIMTTFVPQDDLPPTEERKDYKRNSKDKPLVDEKEDEKKTEEESPPLSTDKIRVRVKFTSVQGQLQ